MATWMVVEDEPDIYDVLLAMFEIWGIEGVAFVDGGEAVAWLDSVDRGEVVGELPELAILDIRLPELSGPEVGARIRKSERLGQIAVVLITAYKLPPSQEEEVKAQAQADMLMYKPLPLMPELRQTLDAIIVRRKTLRTAVVPLPAVQIQTPAQAAPTQPSEHPVQPTQSPPAARIPEQRTPTKPLTPPKTDQPVEPPTPPAASVPEPSPAPTKPLTPPKTDQPVEPPTPQPPTPSVQSTPKQHLT